MPLIPAALRAPLRLPLAVWRGMSERHLGLIAAGVGYYTLLAIFPAVTALVGLWGLWADPVAVAAQMEAYRPLMPQTAFDLLSAQVTAVAGATSQSLGWATGVSLAAALWASRLGVSALIGGLNAVHGTRPRGGLAHTALSLLLTGVLIGVALVALASVVMVPVVLAYLPQGSWSALLLDGARWVVALGAVLGGIVLLYRFGPNRAPGGAPSRRPTPGAIIAVLLWLGASWAFSAYLTRFGDYNRIYGTLGAVIALVSWFWLSAWAILLGALIDAERARARDIGPGD